MKFKVDQNLPTEFAPILRQAGHDALTVFDQELGGAPDPQIVAVCQREGRMLITADLDLSVLVTPRRLASTTIRFPAPCPLRKPRLPPPRRS